MRYRNILRDNSADDLPKFRYRRTNELYKDKTTECGTRFLTPTVLGIFFTMDKISIIPKERVYNE